MKYKEIRNSSPDLHTVPSVDLVKGSRSLLGEFKATAVHTADEQSLRWGRAILTGWISVHGAQARALSFGPSR